jgi:hypothetical protein
MMAKTAKPKRTAKTSKRFVLRVTLCEDDPVTRSTAREHLQWAIDEGMRRLPGLLERISQARVTNADIP